MADDLAAELAAFEAEIAQIASEEPSSNDVAGASAPVAEKPAAAPYIHPQFVPRQHIVHAHAQHPQQKPIPISQLRPGVIISAPVVHSTDQMEESVDDDANPYSHLPEYNQLLAKRASEANSAAALASAAIAQANGVAVPSAGGVRDVHAEDQKAGPQKKRKHVRAAAGDVWVDPTLDEWPDNDFRIFCGDLGNEINDVVLGAAFKKYRSFNKAKVIRDKRTGKTKGFGFVSFLDPNDGALALKEMDGKYVGNRPIKLRKSAWKEREMVVARKKKKLIKLK